jgi:hypothetical protein
MYGEFKWEEKYKTWDIIRSIHQNNSLRWVVMGDLNKNLFDQEKEGGESDPQGICRTSIMRLMIAIYMTWLM